MAKLQYFDIECISDDGDFRKTSCVLNLMSTFYELQTNTEYLRHEISILYWDDLQQSSTYLYPGFIGNVSFNDNLHFSYAYHIYSLLW